MKAVMGKVHTSWPVSVGWTVLSIVTASILAACYNGPAWYHIKRRAIRPDDDPTIVDGAVTFGLASYCRRTTCTGYGDSVRTQFAYIPDPWWKVAYVLFGSGSVFFGYSAVCALICQLLPNVNLRKSVAHYTGYVQAVGVVLLTTALLCFPAGLGNDFVSRNCGGPSATGPFRPGSCQLGWTYALAIMSTVVSIYCPYLASYTYYYEYSVELIPSV